VLFDAWGLPDTLVATALHHHSPLTAPRDHLLLVALVSIATQLALASGHVYSLEPVTLKRDLATLALLGLTPAYCDEVAGELAERVASLQSVISPQACITA
jgi:HD-like signal output (HDOD) protein